MGSEASWSATTLLTTIPVFSPCASPSGLAGSGKTFLPDADYLFGSEAQISFFPSYPYPHLTQWQKRARTWRMSTQYEERQRLTPAYPRFSLAEAQVGFMEAL